MFHSFSYLDKTLSTAFLTPSLLTFSTSSLSETSLIYTQCSPIYTQHQRVIYTSSTVLSVHYLLPICQSSYLDSCPLLLNTVDRDPVRMSVRSCQSSAHSILLAVHLTHNDKDLTVTYGALPDAPPPNS